MFVDAALAGFFAGAGLIVAIGSQNAFVLRQGLLGRHVALVVATCVFGDVVLIVGGVAGMGALVGRWPVVLDVLRFGGAAFLAVYGLMAARRAWQASGGLIPGAEAEVSRSRVLLTTLAFTFLNPHVYLDTTVLLGSLSTRYPDPAHWVFALGASLASIIWFTSLGFGSRLLLPAFRNAKTWRLLDAGIAVFMLALSLLLVIRPLG